MRVNLVPRAAHGWKTGGSAKENRMPRLLLLVVALLAAAAFGCGFFNPEPTRVPSTPVPTLPRGAEVEEVDIANFQLADLEVKVGTVVIWTNTDRTLHTLTHVADEGGSALFNSGTISPSAGFRWHFTEPGVFQYQCLIHPVNMKATVTVAE